MSFVSSASCSSLHQDVTQLIECGRASADPIKGKITHNFFRRPDLLLTSATWFIKEGDGTSDSNNNSNDGKRPILTPISDEDATIIEEHYQKAIKACSSLDGQGIDSILKEEVMLPHADNTEVKRSEMKEDGDTNDDEEKEVVKENQPASQQKQQQYRIMVVKGDGNKLMMRKSAMGWFGKSYDLQRGYGNYTIEDEDIELSLGPVKNVVFVIHGIGEAMFSREDVAIDSTSERINQARNELQKRQVDEWKRKCDVAKQKKYESVVRFFVGDVMLFYARPIM